MPVLIKNFRDIEGGAPNESYKYDTSRLVHRFFIYDTISGIDQKGGYNVSSDPSVIRYASKVKLTV